MDAKGSSDIEVKKEGKNLKLKKTKRASP